MRVYRSNFKPWAPSEGDLKAGMRAYELGSPYRTGASVMWKAGWQKAHKERQAEREKVMAGGRS